MQDDVEIDLKCGIRTYNTIARGDGFIIVKDILHEECRQSIVDTFLHEVRSNKRLNEDRYFHFYSSEPFLREISTIIGEKVYPVNSLDLHRCWLRYYFEGMNAQYYENYHHDSKRYDSSIRQYRLVIPIYDTSDTKFTIDNYGEFPFTQNMGVFIEAGNCYHKVHFNRGERLLLFMDFITKDCDSAYGHYSCRGPIGYYNWIKDGVWRNISSMYYQLHNA